MLKRLSLKKKKKKKKQSTTRLALMIASALASALVLDARLARSDDASITPAITISSTPATKTLGSPIGRDFLRMLGPGATTSLAPSSGLIGALVAIPNGSRAEDFGLDRLTPGIGRMRGSVAKIDAFATAHPDLRVEVAPPLHPLMDRANGWVQATLARTAHTVDGKGVMVGVADTGLDVTNPEMLDKDGNSRVAWMLDLSLEPSGKHADLENQFGVKDDTGKVVNGRVFDKTELNQLLAALKSGLCTEKSGKMCAPTDEIGHGTHVTGIATASGLTSKYGGIAPNADIVFVRVTRGASDGIENDDLVTAVNFMFDRADAMKQPMIVNLSLGSDFGPHDGTFLWEQAIAAQVGPDHPGRIVVAAAGNSGSISETPIHQSVRVTKGAVMSVPISTSGADNGSVQVWITLRKNADLTIGLDGPDGEWIAPVEQGHQNGKNTADYNAGVIYGANLDGSPIPQGSNGAVVVWQGKWPTGTYNITLEGEGMAELYMQGIGDASIGGDRPAAFTNGVREGTINLPATNPSIIGVGCTVNRPRWTSIGGAEVALKVPVLDAAGGLPAGGHRDLDEGEVCWFSSAGPTATGVPKPEISAPGALVISALSRGAAPGNPESVFTSSTCPPNKLGTADQRCLQIDATHGIAIGTSMSSPVVAGVVALLLQQDPTLTQDKVLALLQAGAHHFRGAAPFDDQGGPGEVDAMGALDALAQMQNPVLFLPALQTSWLTLSSDYVPADGSTEMTAIVELRTADGNHRGDFFDLSRLQATLLIDDQPQPPPVMLRRGPGVYFYVWNPPSGFGGSRATFGATFDGQPIVATQTIPIAPDRWTAAYPSYAKGSSCSASPRANERDIASGGAVLLLASLLGLTRRKRSRNVTPLRS